MKIKYPIKTVLGSEVNNFPKVQYDKIKEIIDKVNDLSDGSIDTNSITPASGVLTVNADTIINGALDVNNAANLKSDVYISGLFYLTGTPQTLTGAGAVNITTKTTLLVTTGINALTLANGTDGQIKTIIHKTYGGNGILTPTNLLGGTTITFSAIGQTATLLFKDGKWNVIGLVGAVLA